MSYLCLTLKKYFLDIRDPILDYSLPAHPNYSLLDLQSEFLLNANCVVARDLRWQGHNVKKLAHKRIFIPDLVSNNRAIFSPFETRFENKIVTIMLLIIDVLHT
jgi:hypothetical protein